MAINKSLRSGLVKGLIGASLAGFSVSAMAQAAPGWYFGLEGFYSDVEDIDGTLTIDIPDVVTGSPNSCILPIDLLGLAVGLTPDLCVLGNNSTATLTPGSSTTVDSTIKMDDGFGGGASFGYMFDGGLRPELNLRYAENDVKSIQIAGGGVASTSNASIRAIRLMANVWYDVDLGNFAPYFGGGIGMQNTELKNSNTKGDDDTLTFQLGGGLGYWFGNSTLVSLDYRYITAEDPEFKSTGANGVKTNLEGEYKAHNIGASFRYSFGGEFKDSDGDGVLDRKDKCPNTPQGVQVYSDGCPIDLDQDGVPDYLDKCPNTTKGLKVDATGCVRDAQTIVLQNVNFEFNKATLTADAKSVLNDVAKGLVSQKDLRVEIAGHTDSKGSDAYNLNLSNGRAASVKSYLISQGVAPSQLVSKGYGEGQPVATNDTDAGRAQNRRVEFRVLSQPGASLR